MDLREFERFCRQNDLRIFTVNDLKVLLSGLSPEYLRVKVGRWAEKGVIRILKKGVYAFAEAVPDEFEIAAKLVTPSYISLESALSHYSIIPEVGAEVTSITSKNTRHFNVGGTRYEYYHIKQPLFSDFVYLTNGVLIATREKAILDFIYFRKPLPDHPFFERLNASALKDVNFSRLKQISKIYPAWAQKITKHFIYAAAK
jgi:predicted transcriptional regulator of viral defense system